MTKNIEIKIAEHYNNHPTAGDRNNKEGIVTYLEKYEQISKLDLDMISSEFQFLKVKAGNVVSGTVADKLYFISSGIIKITIPKEQTRNGVYYFMVPNQFMSFLYSLYTNTKAIHGLEAATDCDLLFIDKTSLFKLYERIPYFRSLLDAIAHLSMAEMINMKDMLLSLDALDSYKMLLNKQPEIALSVPLIDIATYLGITPQSLSRIRRQI
jgi:CRP-like cAMP-binding protein